MRPSFLWDVVVPAALAFCAGLLVVMGLCWVTGSEFGSSLGAFVVGLWIGAR